jgi:hypothetical protein
MPSDSNHQVDGVVNRDHVCHASLVNLHNAQKAFANRRNGS